MILNKFKLSLFYHFSIQVLAHRGQHWTLLQNASRTLWNCAHTALLRAFTSDPNGEDGLLTIAELRSLVWKPFHMAADCLLDMMVQLQVDLDNQAAKVRILFNITTFLARLGFGVMQGMV